MPNLLQAILSALLGVPLGGRGLGGLARQVGGGVPGGGGVPAPIGPYGRVRAARRAAADDGGVSYGPAPGATGEVSAPTADQVRQSRLAGTDTPPTEGFSEALRSDRAKFADELNNPRTKWEALAVMASEMDVDPAAVAESLLNRSDYAKTSIHNMIHSGFYNPVNKGALPRIIRNLQANPERTRKMMAGLETAMRGSNLIGGATDQGSGNDPNVGHRGGRVTRFGEVYNDWGGGPGGHAGAANYRRQQQMRVRAESQRAEQGRSLVTGPIRLALDLGMGNRNALPVPGAEIGPQSRARGGISGVQTLDEERKKRERQRREATAL